MKPGYLVKVSKPTFKGYWSKKVPVYSTPRGAGFNDELIVGHFTETDFGLVIESTSRHEGWVRILFHGKMGWIYPSYFETLKRVK
jgi:hypothetical protein